MQFLDRLTLAASVMDDNNYKQNTKNYKKMHFEAKTLLQKGKPSIANYFKKHKMYSKYQKSV